MGITCQRLGPRRLALVQLFFVAAKKYISLRFLAVLRGGLLQNESFDATKVPSASSGYPVPYGLWAIAEKPTYSYVVCSTAMAQLWPGIMWAIERKRVGKNTLIVST